MRARSPNRPTPRPGCDPVSAAGGPDPGWTHRVVPPARGAPTSVLFLFHGTGGDETSLLELAAAVAPDHLLVGVRGRSDEEGVTRYFRRFDALRYDQAHLTAEARALAAFVRTRAVQLGAERLPRTALGYSNGANIALAALLLDPGCLARAALLRPVQPFERPPSPRLDGTELLLLSGATDPYRPAGSGLPALLEGLGARVEHDVLDAGHGLTQADVARLTLWFAPPPSLP